VREGQPGPAAGEDDLSYHHRVPDDSSSFDDAAIERLRLAAEEVAWLTGRGYPLGVVGDLVAAHHALTDDQRSALARGTCSEPQYRRRAARELEAEDVARRPLAIDAIDVVATIEAALAGRPVLQTLDGTVRAFGVDRTKYGVGPNADEAIGRVLTAGKELRPSVLRFIVDERAPGAEDLAARIEARAKAMKAKVDVVRAPNALSALKKEKQIVTGDADTLDGCASWFNLVGLVVLSVAGAKIIRLQ
jgi:hypothetical protein